MKATIKTSVGTQIRAERARRGLSRDELAAASGVSAGWIGRIERGSAQPSVQVIQWIADALGVSPAVLVADAGGAGPTPSPTDTGIDVIRAGHRTAVRFPDSHHFWEILTPNLRGRLQVLVVELLPDEPRPIELFSHAGEEVFFVMSGQVALEIDGEEVILNAGDSATISSIRPHRLRNAGAEEAQLLSATTPPFF